MDPYNNLYIILLCTPIMVPIFTPRLPLRSSRLMVELQTQIRMLVCRVPGAPPANSCSLVGTHVHELYGKYWL